MGWVFPNLLKSVFGSVLFNFAFAGDTETEASQTPLNSYPLMTVPRKFCQDSMGVPQHKSQSEIWTYCLNYT